MADSEETTPEDIIDLDSIPGTSSSPANNGVNVPGGRAFGGTSAIIENMHRADDTPTTIDTTVADERVVLELVKDVATLDEVKTSVKADATVKIANVQEAEQDVENASKIAVKAEQTAVVAVESAKKIIEMPDILESTKIEAKKLAAKATKEAEIAKKVEKKATEKKVIAVKTAEKAVAKVKEVEKKKEIVEKKLGKLHDVIDPTTGPTIKYQDVCIGLFEKDGAKVVGVCPASEGKCPVSWNESRCLQLKPVKTSVMDAPITTFW